MAEVVNLEITVEAMAMDQSRINLKLERIEDTKQLNQTHSTKISDVSDFLGLLKDASEFEEEDASKFDEGDLERVELVASKGNTNPNGENRLMEVYMATEVSKKLEQVGSINLMLKPEKSLKPVAIQSWQTGAMKLGWDAIVLTQTAESRSIGFLSQSFNDGKSNVEVPIMSYCRQGSVMELDTSVQSKAFVNYHLEETTNIKAAGNP
ncbi:hypothetical protein GIB67_010930 [Kingdonia uniflora]|uniref:Uncharacterized protein n=1 Tax=Kingdonia uniflora TaxID=39325 RepID=A0A7J7M4S4_9MAGN|nr:hypothetical protein GIB67_010930 [Kingdonia uniflora]